MARGQAPSLVVHQGEVLNVKLLEQVSSKDAKTGSPVKMEALTDLVVGGRVVVRRGAPLTARLAVVEKKAKSIGSGRISLQIEAVEMANGEPLGLDGTRTAAGGMVGKKLYRGMMIASIVTLSTAGAVATMLSRGDEIVLPEGTALEATVTMDTTLDPEEFPVADSGVTAISTSPIAKVRFETSTEDGSVSVDDEFVGEAPVSVDLKRGVHTVRVNRDGYKRWLQRVVIDGDEVKLVVRLEKK